MNVRSHDIAGLAVVVLFAVMATLNGVDTGWQLMDVDEAVYRSTLEAMRDGEGYYEASREALIVKEGQPPTAVRAIRPPTLYLFLAQLPPAAWRWVAALPWTAALAFAWWLGRRHGALGAVLAPLLAGVWVHSFSTFLFLHAEPWAAPLLLAAAAALRRDRHGWAAGFVLGAVLLRELAVVGLVVGLVLGWRHHRRPWLVASAAAALFGAIHAVLASRVLSSVGYEARLGNEELTWAFLGRHLAAGSETPLRVLAAAAVLLGLVGAARALRRDPAAAFALPVAATIGVASVLATRVYWSALWLPLLAPFAGAALSGARVPTRPGRPGRPHPGAGTSSAHGSTPPASPR